MSAPGLKQLAVMLDIVATTDHPGEAAVALNKAVQLIRKTGLRGSDFIAAMIERDRALDALAKYEVKLTALEAENKRLNAGVANGHGGGTLARALWQDAGMPRTVESRHAQWVLALEAQGLIHLTSKEIDFLGSCSRRSRLSQAQQNWLQNIIRTAIARSGQAPPP
jgi:hypothetical protein